MSGCPTMTKLISGQSRIFVQKDHTNFNRTICNMKQYYRLYGHNILSTWYCTVIPFFSQYLSCSPALISWFTLINSCNKLWVCVNVGDDNDVYTVYVQKGVDGYTGVYCDWRYCYVLDKHSDSLLLVYYQHI